MEQDALLSPGASPGGEGAMGKGGKGRDALARTLLPAGLSR